MTLERRVAVYVLAVCTASLAVLAAALRVHPIEADLSLAVLLSLTVVTMVTNVRNLRRNTAISVTSIVVLAAIALVGPAGAAVVSALPWLLEPVRRMPLVRVFNACMQLLYTGLAGLVYWALGGTFEVAELTASSDTVRHLVLPLLLANVVQCVVNAALLAGVISLDQRVPWREVLVGTLRDGGVAYVGYGLFGILLAVLWEGSGVGWLAAVLVLAPLFVARWAYAQYAAENQAHERTLAALIGAVETKDVYTKGHSERVARAAVLIARAVGLGQERTSTLHVAGMLHDVGKLGVPTHVLRKGGPLTDEEFASIALHPVRGLEMVREIEFLGEALEGILHHHERLDGRGYPMGLVGDAIPEFARIIAVADAFDAMTSTRSYRGARTVDDALEELRRCTGSQFEGRYVEALAGALDRDGWQPSGAVPPGQEAAGEQPARTSYDDGGVPLAVPFDHDDPTCRCGVPDSGRAQDQSRDGREQG